MQVTLYLNFRGNAGEARVLLLSLGHKCVEATISRPLLKNSVSSG